MTEPADPKLPDSPHARAVLHRRAVRLAHEGEALGRAPQGGLYLAVRLGRREQYGIPYRWLDEIQRPRGVTPVPGAPAFVAGVMARRGSLIAVIDLARLFNVQPDEAPAETRLVVVSGAGLTVALRVDEVLGNERYLADALDPAPPQAGPIGPGWIAGIHLGRLTMLDIDALLNDPRIKIEERT